MTEHEHTPPIRTWYRVAHFSPGKVLINMPGCEYVLNREEAAALRDALDAALDGDGPQIVCEVVR